MLLSCVQTGMHSTAQQADWFACIASVDAEARGHWGSAIREGQWECPALLHVLPAGSMLRCNGEED